MVNKMHSMSVLCFALTLAAYVLVKKLYRRYPYLLLSPALFVPFLMILFMLAFNVSYDTYMEENQWIVWMLGPATVAFAIPIYEYRQVMHCQRILFSQAVQLQSGNRLQFNGALYFNAVRHRADRKSWRFG